MPNTNSLVFTGIGSIACIVLTSSASSASTLTIYDNTTSSGSVLVTLKAAVSASVVAEITNKEFGTGVYAVLAGADSRAYIDIK